MKGEQARRDFVDLDLGLIDSLLESEHPAPLYLVPVEDNARAPADGLFHQRCHRE